MTGGEENSHRDPGERGQGRGRADNPARSTTAAAERRPIAAAAARILARSIGMAQLYPAHHPKRAEPLRQFTGFLNRVLRDEGEIQALIAGRRFLINGALAPEASEAAATVIARFKALRLRGFHVTQPVSESASEALLEVLTQPAEQIERDGGAVMFLAQLDPQSAFTLLETDAAASVGQIAQAQEAQLEAILSRYLDEDAPVLTAEQVQIMRGLLGEPRLVALLLRTAATLTDSLGGNEDAAGKLVEQVLLDLATHGQVDVRRLHETFAQAEADGLLDASDLALPEPPPDTDATADAPAGDREEEARLEVVHQLLTGRGAAPATAPNPDPSVELLFAGDAGKRKLARLLHREMKRQQQQPEDLRRSIMELLSAALPAITPDSRLAFDLDELLQLVAELESFDLRAGHAYALAELAHQETDPSARRNALDRLLPYIHDALAQGRLEQADSLLAAITELTEADGAATKQIANHAAAKCAQIVSSDEFTNFTQDLEDRTILQSESARAILTRLGRWLADWLVTRAAASSSERVKLALTNILTTVGQDRVGPALRAGMGQFEPADDSLLIFLLHRVDPVAFHRYCKQALEQADDPLSQMDVLALLNDVRDPEAVNTLQPALQSHTRWLRIEALLCLGRIGTPNAAAILRHTAAHGDWLGRRYPLRRAAVSALGTLRDQEAIPVLTALLEKRFSLRPRRHRQLRQQAADALAAVDTEAAVAALRGVRSGRARAASRLAAAALAQRDEEQEPHERAEGS